MSKLRIALIGAGQRGKDVFGKYGLDYPDKVQFVAVAEPNRLKREAMAAMHRIPSEYQFEDWKGIFEKERFCDAVIIATSDNMHYGPAMQALEKGYHVLLEKPMSNKLKECIELGETAKKLNRTFMICHVLRYTAFFGTLKEIIDSGVIGEVRSIQHNENIGYYHFAHSFVRGNWRNSDETSPLILAKSCHDMDILLWLTGSKCKKVSSFGSLSFFRHDKAYEGAGSRCLTDCPIVEACVFAAQKTYFNNIGKWPSTVVSEIQDMPHLVKALEEGPYGRCVFKCDNNVVDHQVTLMEFENGVTATFNLSAFTTQINRTLKIMGTKGEIRGNDRLNELEVSVFGSDEVKTIKPEVVEGSHGGGDTSIMEDFICLCKGHQGKALTAAEISVQSHIMAFAAEQSRLENRVIDIDEFYRMQTQK